MKNKRLAAAGRIACYAGFIDSPAQVWRYRASNEGCAALRTARLRTGFFRGTWIALPRVAAHSRAGFDLKAISNVSTFIAEVTGTMILITLGNAVVANVVLQKSRSVAKGSRGTVDCGLASPTGQESRRDMFGIVDVFGIVHTTATNRWPAENLAMGNLHEVSRKVQAWRRQPHPKLARVIALSPSHKTCPLSPVPRRRRCVCPRRRYFAIVRLEFAV